MYHSVFFGSKNSYSDWHLVPDGRPVIVNPEVRNLSVEIPGISGTVDLTESLTKYPTYKDRSGSLKFHVLNDYADWVYIYQSITNTLHGKRTTLRLEDDPDWIYDGRFSVQWTSNNDGTWSDVDVNYVLDPYKRYKTSSSITNTLSSGTNTATHSVFQSLMAYPVVPVVRITSNSTPGLTFSVTNSELGLTNVSMKPISITGTFPLYSCVISNMSGGSTGSVLKVSKTSGSATYTITYERKLL